MAIEVSKWMAADGQLFGTKEDAEAHEETVVTKRYVASLAGMCTAGVELSDAAVDAVLRNILVVFTQTNGRKLIKELLTLTSKPYDTQ